VENDNFLRAPDIVEGPDVSTVSEIADYDLVGDRFACLQPGELQLVA
jgi:hypothetical protein